MSFDVYLTIPACTHCGNRRGTAWSFNLTHNLNSAVDLCLVAGGATKAKTEGSGYDERSWGRLNGWSAAEAQPILERALVWCRANMSDLLKLDPDNGWGTAARLPNCFLEFIAACAENPNAMVETSG